MRAHVLRIGKRERRTERRDQGYVLSEGDREAQASSTIPTAALPVHRDAFAPGSVEPAPAFRRAWVSPHCVNMTVLSGLVQAAGAEATAHRAEDGHAGLSRPLRGGSTWPDLRPIVRPSARVEGGWHRAGRRASCVAGRLHHAPPSPPTSAGDPQCDALQGVTSPILDRGIQPGVGGRSHQRAARVGIYLVNSLGRHDVARHGGARSRAQGYSREWQMRFAHDAARRLTPESCGS